MASARVFTIPASTPFVPTLIRALVDGTLVPGFPAGRDPLPLPGAALYPPARRARPPAHDPFPREPCRARRVLAADAAVSPDRARRMAEAAVPARRDGTSRAA